MEQGGRGRRLAVGGLAVLLAAALVVATRESATPAELLERAAASGKPAVQKAGRTQKLSFAQWYQEQSAAAWFGDDTMPKKVQVGNQHFAEKNDKTKWLTQQDLNGIPGVLQAAHAKKLKHEAVQLAMARLAAKQHANGLATALKQQLAGYGDMAELNRIGDDEAKRLAHKAPAAAVKGRAALQELFQLTQKLEGADAEEIYRPIATEGDGPDLPDDRIFSIVNGLDNKFLNRSTTSFKANKKHLLAKTPEEIAQAKADDAAKKKAEDDAEAVISQAAPKLQAMLTKQMQLKTEQADKLSQLTKTLDDVLTPQGYADADITQCGDHCAEVQIAAETARRQQRHNEEAETAEEDNELNAPIASRR